MVGGGGECGVWGGVVVVVGVGVGRGGDGGWWVVGGEGVCGCISNFKPSQLSLYLCDCYDIFSIASKYGFPCNL